MEALGSTIARAQNGDLEAYGLIISRFQDMAYGYAYSILADFHLAEDAAQEAFIQAYRELSALREPEAFASWFRRIVFTQCTRLTRGKRLEVVPLQDVAKVPSSDPSPSDAAEQSEFRERVLELVKALPEGERAVTTLFYINGYPHDEIADFLEVPVSTVKSRLHTSRKHLKGGMLSMVSDYLRGNALTETFTSRVLEGIPELGWGVRKECTYCGALEAALTLTEHPYDYPTIMGVTGLAFRTRWYQGQADYMRWCPSSAVGEFPEEDEAFRQATGWRFWVEAHLNEEQPKMGRFAADVVKSINAGRPVLGYDTGWNIAVIKGYENDGRVVLMQTYGSPETEKRTLDELPGFLVLFEAYDKPLPHPEMLMHSLRIGARNWDRADGLYMNRGQYLYGYRSFRQWTDDLGRHDEWTDKERELLFFVSWWCFTNLIDARRAAVTFLRDHLDAISGEAREALSRAIGLYEEEINLLSPPSFERQEVFLGPWTGRSFGDWTPNMRRCEQELLMQALEIERAAIGEIQLVLAS